MIKNIRKILVLLVVLAGFITAGCGGGGAMVTQSSTTMGQELMDLDQSYKQGIISEKEYERAKRTILRKYE